MMEKCALCQCLHVKDIKRSRMKTHLSYVFGEITPNSCMGFFLFCLIFYVFIELTLLLKALYSKIL